jgi:hypothetical protein
MRIGKEVTACVVCCWIDRFRDVCWPDLHRTIDSDSVLLRVRWEAQNRHVFACRRIFTNALIIALPFKRTRVMNRHAPTGRRKGHDEST